MSMCAITDAASRPPAPPIASRALGCARTASFTTSTILASIAAFPGCRSVPLSSSATMFSGAPPGSVSLRYQLMTACAP